MTSPRHRTAARAATIALVAALVAAVVVLVPAADRRAGAQGATVQASTTEGSLVWGVKQSWGTYVGLANTHVSGGAAIDDQRVVTFPLTAGSFDEVTSTTDVQFGGSVRYAAHCYPQEGIPAGECALDLTITEPRIVIGTTEQVLEAHVVSRARVAPKELVDYGIIPLVSLDVLTSATVEVVEGVTSWEGISSAITAEASPAFDYPPGTAFAPVAFSYTGPGGAPDVGESWTDPGTPLLIETGRWKDTTATPQADAVFVDAAGEVAHLVTGTFRLSPTAPLVRAFDADTLAPIPTAVYAPTGTIRSVRAFDPASGTVFLTRSATVGGVASVVIDAVTYDPATLAYVVATVATFPNTSVLNNLGATVAWDPADGRLVGLVVVVDPVDSTQRTPTLFTWELEGGTWVEERLPLPAPPAGFTDDQWYNAEATGFTVAGDGSVILVRLFVTSIEGASLAQPSALRLVPGDGAVTAEEIPGTGTDELGPISDDAFNTVVAGGDAVWFSTIAFDPQRVQEARVLPGAGGLELVGEPVLLPPVGYGGMAVDPVDGSLWLKSAPAGQIVAVRDGRVVLQRTVADFAKGANLAVGPDRALFGSFRAEATAPAGTALARFAYEGTSPTVTTQPEPTTVTLGVGEASEQVTLTAAAEGDPAPTVRWQRRARGATSFADLEGETSTTLTFDATAADDGAEVRAVFANLAGALPTDAVELTVLLAPSVALAPVDVAVEPGGEALFAVQGRGNPEPEVTWQRYAGGFWVDVADGSGDVVVDGGFLTIPETNLDMDGTRFRARLSNPVATVLTDVVTLTVEAPVTFPDVPPGHPFHTEITWLVDEGITTGYPDGTFKPLGQVTRQATAAFLHRLAGSPAVPPGAPAFSDVPPGHPFHAEISWLAATGVTEGYEDGTFKPTSTITRQAMAAFLYRYDHLEPAP